LAEHHFYCTTNSFGQYSSLRTFYNYSDGLIKRSAGTNLIFGDRGPVTDEDGPQADEFDFGIQLST